MNSACTGNVKGRSAGGSATARGMDYQHRVSAWVAVQVLAEKSCTSLLGLGVGTTLDSLQCEAEQPVDDLFVQTSSRGRIFGQAKHALDLSASRDSELASALDQFVRQFINCQEGEAGARPLDPLRDRLVLITSSRTSQPIRRHLSESLDRLRSFPKTKPLDRALVNDAERRAVAVIRDHIKKSWRNARGTAPSVAELRELLALIHILVLDVEENEPGEREAKTLLRTAILRDPDRADGTWAGLITLSSGLAARRGGIDRAGLQQRLLEQEIRLRTTLSYQSDIARLREHSAAGVQALAHHSRIQMGGRQAKVERACVTALLNAAADNPLLVIGEPGAGKSGALYDAARWLDTKDQDYVFLAADAIAAASLGALRTEIGLEHELLQVLDNWPGLQPAYLVIDALDAARGQAAEKTIRQLIAAVLEKDGRWRVVASIRKFDLRYSTELRRRFSGSPPDEFCDPEFTDIHHINVSRLSDEELAQVGAQALELRELIALASHQLLELLRVPFNLQLLADLLSGGTSPSELTPIETQLGLLERYWSERIIRSDGLGDAREAILLQACETMVGSRQLRIPRRAVATGDNSSSLNDLLSTQVLVEGQANSAPAPDHYTVQFSHHVLFDYAVARLLMRGPGQVLADRLSTDPEMALVVRPSIQWHFQYLWSLDAAHVDFWDLVFAVVRLRDIPEIAKLIGPSIAAELAESLDDLGILSGALGQTDPQGRAVAQSSLRHLVGALLSETGGGRHLVGASAGPWCAFVEHISRELQPLLAYILRPILLQICKDPRALSSGQREAAGKTARRLLELAWSMDRMDVQLVIHALQCVCRTFESDAPSSAELVRRCLDPLPISQHGFEIMPGLAAEVKFLIRFDARLVEDIYRVAFGYVETSDEATSMGTSRILPLSSNRRQDYHMALYELSGIFGEFLEGAPEHATRAVIRALDAYMIQRHGVAVSAPLEEAFDVNGQQAFLRTDYSVDWDGSEVYGADDAMKMLGEFQRYLTRLAADTNEATRLRALVQIVIAESKSGLLWRRLLLLGAEYPLILGEQLLPLAWAMPILISYDTSAAAGKFLHIIYPLRRPDEQERIDRAILCIPDRMPSDRGDAALHIRNRLLGCIPAPGPATDDAQKLVAELTRANATPANEIPPVEIESEWQDYSQDDIFREQGVRVDTPANAKLRDVEKPAEEFREKYLNSVPNRAAALAILPALKTLREVLSGAEVETAHPSVREHGWEELAAVCARIVRGDDWLCSDEAGKFVLHVLLEAARNPNPPPVPEQDQRFDESGVWASGTRIDAAQGLIMLGRLLACSSPELFDAIERLATDPVAAVRLQVAASAHRLYGTRRQLMWTIVEQASRTERSRSVLRGLLLGPLRSLAWGHPARVTRLTKMIFERVHDDPSSDSVREACVRIFAGLYIRRNVRTCQKIVHEIASAPTIRFKEAGHIVGQLREALTHGPTDPPARNEDAVRQRAVDLLGRLVSSAASEFQQIEAKYGGMTGREWLAEDLEGAKSLAQLLDHASREIYFASGAHQDKRGAKDTIRSVTRQQAARFYAETAAIFDVLADLGFPAITHQLMQTLEHFVPIDPRGVFLRMGRVIRAGAKGGYQYEALAVNLIVQLVERYLADYRTLLHGDPECRGTLIEILDIFVDAGWSGARRLTYSLDQIFR